MALGDPYGTVGEFKDWTTITDGLDDALIDRALKAASRSVERFCHRPFNDAGAATPRVFTPASSYTVYVDDFHTSVGLVVAYDNDDDGTYETTVSSSNYVLCPLDGIVDGQAGWPFNRVEIVEVASKFPTYTVRPSVQVTARWGWAAVPADVVQATYIHATRLFGRRYSHNGTMGQGEFVFGVERRLDPDVRALLKPYQRRSVLVG